MISVGTRTVEQAQHDLTLVASHLEAAGIAKPKSPAKVQNIVATADIGFDPKLDLIKRVEGSSMNLSAVLISTGFPFLFKKANLDPAIASGPFATMISDVATVTIYFTVASILLASFGLM